MASTPALPHNRPPSAVRRRRRDKVKGLIKRMRQRRREKRLAYRSAFADDTPLKRRKRKAALAISAGVMGFSTAATGLGPYVHTNAVVKSAKPGIDFRTKAALLGVSDDMKEALAEEEGVRLSVYRDVAGYPTVGVGHLVTSDDNLNVGDQITYDQAIDFLEADLATAEKAVAKLVGDLELYQHEFDALVDLVYNVGLGNVSPSESPRLNAAIDAGDYAAIAEQLDYTHAGGEFARGLMYRSERRAKIFMDASYEDPREAAQSTSA